MSGHGWVNLVRQPARISDFRATTFYDRRFISLHEFAAGNQAGFCSEAPGVHPLRSETHDVTRIVLTLCLGALAVASIPVESALAQSRKKPAAKNAPAKKAPPPPPKVNLPVEAPRTNIKIAPVEPSQREHALRSASIIDGIIERGLEKAGMEPNLLVPDEAFVRRVYLDITGTIPTSREYRSFMASRSPDKRTVLIDKLLNEPGYASHFYNYWADILRIVDKVDNNTYLRPYGDWVKQSLRENKPYDKMVHDMIAAEGRVWENPAVGFTLRDNGMPLDNLNNMVRTFLGTRIGCAQCHDHPFDKWSQNDFYKLAAFVSGTEFRINGKMGINVSDKQIMAASPGEKSPEYRNARSILRLNRPGIWQNARKQLKYPADYQYQNAKPNQLVEASVLWGNSSKPIKPENRREVLADWIASEDNPRFPLTIANRLWKRALGVGVIEPVDDMMDESKPSNPELMDFLVAEMKRVQFNLKEFQRIIYFTKTYQRRATYDDLSPTDSYRFPGPVLRRMSAEQVWDSLVTLTLPNPDQILRPEDESYTSIIGIDGKTTPQQVVAKAAEMQEWRKQDGLLKRKRLYKGAELMRASELPQPLPDAHFLRQFGQSERDSISESHTDGTVPQLLTMFNGQVSHMMLEYGSVMVTDVMAKSGLDDQCEMMFICILSRLPTEEEKAIAVREMRSTMNDKTNKLAGHGNVLWALLNTREFLFVQ